MALECARLQHRLSLPPLEVEDISQNGVTFLQNSTSSGHETDLLEEILSVSHHASQQFTNQSVNLQDHNTWVRNYGQADDFNFAQFDIGKSSWGDPNTRSIEIGDIADEIKTERTVENLRWVGMSHEDLQKVNPHFLYICHTPITTNIYIYKT